MNQLHYTDDQGRVWRPFMVQYTNDEGTFHVLVSALSMQHAELVVTDLRETATLVGELVGVV